MNVAVSGTAVATTGRQDALQTALRSGGAVGTLLVLIVYVGLWLHLTPYGGLGHDAQAYAIEALVNLKPQIYAQDLFLTYRSQEEFTVFPRLFAGLVELFGLEDAAAWTVLLCHLLWYAAAFLLIRQLVGPTMALFAVGALLTITGTYGGFRVFHFAENFLTARLPAEVLALFGLWLFVRGRWLLACGLLVAAIAVHPLIAFPAAVLAACCWIAERRSLSTVAALLAVGIIVALAGSWFLGGSSPFMEGRWLVVTQMRSGFLFLDFWRLNDWNDTILGLATLALASMSLERRPARLMAACALGVALAGLVLAVISSVWLHLEVLIQGQPWRWLWIARFFAIALLPATLITAWQGGPAGRGAALLLAAAWLFVVPISSKTPVLLMLGALLATIAAVVWAVRGRLSAETQRIAYLGSIAILVAVLAASVVTMALAWEVMTSEADSPVSWSTTLTRILTLLTPGLAVAMLACIAARVAWSPFRGATIAVIGIVLLATGIVNAAPGWMDRPFSGANYDAFAQWREIIPEDEEVLWYDNLRETWFLLERRGYLTRSQSGGVVFSEALADEVVRRALVLEPYIDRNFWIAIVEGEELEPNPLSRDILGRICLDPELGFVVSGDSTGDEIASMEWPQPGQNIHLYRCSDFREGGQR